MTVDLEQLQTACAERIAAAQKRKEELLASINAQLDPEDYEDAMNLDPRQAMIEIGAAEFRELLGMLPHDCDDETSTICTLGVQKRKLGSTARSVTLHCRHLAHICREVGKHRPQPAKSKAKE